jgi:hypothetical protein
MIDKSASAKCIAFKELLSTLDGDTAPVIELHDHLTQNRCLISYFIEASD